MLVSGAFASSASEYETNCYILEAERVGDWCSVIADGADGVIPVQMRSNSSIVNTTVNKSSFQKLDNLAPKVFELNNSLSSSSIVFLFQVTPKSYPNKYLKSVLNLQTVK